MLVNFCTSFQMGSMRVQSLLQMGQCKCRGVNASAEFTVNGSVQAQRVQCECRVCCKWFQCECRIYGNYKDGVSASAEFTVTTKLCPWQLLQSESGGASADFTVTTKFVSLAAAAIGVRWCECRFYSNYKVCVLGSCCNRSQVMHLILTSRYSATRV